MLALGKAIPAPAVKLREGLGRWIRFEKIQRYFRFQIAKNLQWTRVVLFEGYLDLIEKPIFLAHEPLVISGDYLELLGRGGVRLQSSQTSMIGSQKIRQHISIKKNRSSIGSYEIDLSPDPEPWD